MSGISALRERDVVRLWKCVLFTALSDLKSCEKHQERVAAREEAEAWLRKDSPDFREVCEVAGYCPERVYRVGRQLIAMREAKQNGATVPELAKAHPNMIEFFMRSRIKRVVKDKNEKKRRVVFHAHNVAQAMQSGAESVL